METCKTILDQSIDPKNHAALPLFQKKITVLQKHNLEPRG